MNSGNPPYREHSHMAGELLWFNYYDFTQSQLLPLKQKRLTGVGIFNQAHYQIFSKNNYVPYTVLIYEICPAKKGQSGVLGMCVKRSLFSERCLSDRWLFLSVIKNVLKSSHFRNGLACLYYLRSESALEVLLFKPGTWSQEKLISSGNSSDLGRYHQNRRMKKRIIC